MKICTVCKNRGDLPKLLVSRGLIGKGVEIGVRKGEYAEIILRDWPGYMYLVDPWRDNLPGYTDTKPDWHNENDYQLTMSRLSPFAPRWTIIRETSDIAYEKIPVLDLDFVYVDANHKKEFVAEDLRLWWGMLRTGGILAGHDLFLMEHLDVTEAVVEFAHTRHLTTYIIPGSVDNVCRDGQIPSYYFIKP